MKAKETLHKSIIIWKNDLSRSDAYEGLIFRCAGIATMFKIFEFKWWVFLVIIPIYIVFKKITGYYDRRKGIKSSELRRNALDNPIQKEIYEKINKIHAEIINNRMY